MLYRISCVCLGNICRSPIAETVLADRLAKAGLSNYVELDSSGTAAWHVGEDMDERARRTLEANGYRKNHEARQLTQDSLPRYNLILAMDRANIADIVTLTASAGLPNDHVRLFRSFDPTATEAAEVPDPYYGDSDGFDAVLRMAERAADGVVAFVRTELDTTG